MDRLKCMLAIASIFIVVILLGAVLGALQGMLINWTNCGHPLRTCEDGRAVSDSTW